MQNHEPGATTRDLRAAGHISPAEMQLPRAQHEDRTQRIGRILLITGVAVLAATYASALIVAIVAERESFETRNGALFATLAMNAAASLGTILIAFGLAERLHRPHRSMSRLSYSAGQAILDRLDKLEQRLSDQQDQADLNAGALHRIEQTMRTIPNTGEIIAKALRLSQSSDSRNQ
ncbi:MAG TPA: hypothetical protein VI172_08395 [Candidatus Dormibacteraeota bacterium]